MKTKLLTILLSAMITISLVACGSDESTAEASAEEIKTESAEEQQEAESVPKVDVSKKSSVKVPEAVSDYITVDSLGDDEYQITVGEKVNAAEVCFCEISDDMTYYIITGFADTVDTTDEKSFIVCDNNPGDTADLLIGVYYDGGYKGFALEFDGIDGGRVPTEVECVLADGISDTLDTESSDIASSDDYLGVWGNNRITLEVTGSKSGNMVFTITWPDSAATAYEWNYYCQYNSETGDMECNEMADKSFLTYDESGEFTMESIYDNGSGLFSMVDGEIVWFNFTDDDADTITFSK